MKTIIAGCRDYFNCAAITIILWESNFNITEVVSGGATGVDQCGEIYAEKKGIPIKKFPADWNKHGRAAGPIRNAAMAEYADQLIAFWDGISPGTKSMINIANKKGLKVKMFYIGPQQ